MYTSYAQAATPFPLGPSPTGSATAQQRELPFPGRIPKALPPYNLSFAPRQRNMAQIKEESRASERELSEEEIANLSDGEFKALVIKMLTDLIELGQKMKKQMKTTQSEIKHNVQGTNSDRKETRSQGNNLEQKEKINIHPDQNEEKRIQKSEETRRTKMAA